jgi:hypothetical protein
MKLESQNHKFMKVKCPKVQFSIYYIISRLSKNEIFYFSYNKVINDLWYKTNGLFNKQYQYICESTHIKSNKMKDIHAYMLYFFIIFCLFFTAEKILSLSLIIHYIRNQNDN